MSTTSQRFDPAYFRERDWWRDETIRDWVDRRVAQHGDRLAIATFDTTLTYKQFANRVTDFAAGLHDAGLRRGDIIAVHLPNTVEFLIAWLGINEIGAVMQTIHTPYGPREAEQLLRHSGAKACIALSGPFEWSEFFDKLPALTRDTFRVRSKSGSEEAARRHAATLTLRDVAKNITCPLFIVAGKQDGIVPWQEGERLAAAASGPVLRCFIEDGNHVANNRVYRYRSQSADWMAQRLGVPRH